jgi:hypothetical protein
MRTSALIVARLVIGFAMPAASAGSPNVDRMAKQWTDMARDVLQCQPREYRKVAAAAKTPRRHPEWSDYAEPVAKSTRKAANKAKSLETISP